MKVDPARAPLQSGHFVHEEWPYEPRFKRVNGWRMHYIDEGAGDPVVLLHGNPAWGFLYRKFVKPLTATGRRVIVPDMIGLGLSEKPPSANRRTVSTATSQISQACSGSSTFATRPWFVTIGAARPVSALHSPILTTSALS
jgi:hypothetical protein